MVGNLLLRGMLVGLAAGLVCFIFLRIFGEPPVAQAIALEQAAAVAEAADHARDDATAATAAAGHSHGEDAPVSRTVQAGIGLFTAVAVFGAALGGLFSLAFALVYGRWEALGPRGTAALLGALGFVSVCLVPFFKYPPNPPAVGDPETIGARTALFLALLALSVAGMIAAVMLRTRLVPGHGRWDATLWAGAAYLGAMIVVAALLPGMNELPDSFQAPTLWAFRVAALGGQAILWAGIALGFGLLTHRVASRAPGTRLDAAIA